MEDLRAKRLRQVRVIIDKAESTPYGPERDAFMAKADSLMAAHAIETFELEFAKPVGHREEPELRIFRYFEEGHKVSEHIESNIAYLFRAVAEHCRTLVGFWGYRYSKVVGYKDDLSYLDWMFTSLKMQLAAQMEPTPDPDQSFELNLAMLKEAGLKWERIHQVLKKSGMMEDVPWERKIGVRFTSAYSKFCKETGRQQHYTTPDVWQRSFIQGFVAQIRRRLAAMARANKEANAGKGLVLAGMEEALWESLYGFFPDQRPHPPECECDNCHFLKCPDHSMCIRTVCQEYMKKRNKPVRHKAPVELKVSTRAVYAGQAAGDKADLSGGKGVSNRKEEIA